MAFISQIGQLKTDNHRSQAIDALRGIACMSVFIAHVANITELTSHRLGAIGVMLFFLLSGYCISLSLTNLTKEGGGA